MFCETQLKTVPRKNLQPPRFSKMHMAVSHLKCEIFSSIQLTSILTSFMLTLFCLFSLPTLNVLLLRCVLFCPFRYSKVV